MKNSSTSDSNIEGICWQVTDDDRQLLYVFERGKKKLMEGSSVEFTGSFSSQLTSFLKQTPARRIIILDAKIYVFYIRSPRHDAYNGIKPKMDPLVMLNGAPIQF